MTARTDRAWEIATWPIAAAVWHGLNAVGGVREAFGRVLDAAHPCQWSNAFDDEDEVCRRCGTPDVLGDEVRVQMGGWMHRPCWIAALDEVTSA